MHLAMPQTFQCAEVVRVQFEGAGEVCRRCIPAITDHLHLAAAVPRLGEVGPERDHLIESGLGLVELHLLGEIHRHLEHRIDRGVVRAHPDAPDRDLGHAADEILVVLQRRQQDGNVVHCPHLAQPRIRLTALLEQGARRAFERLGATHGAPCIGGTGGHGNEGSPDSHGGKGKHHYTHCGIHRTLLLRHPRRSPVCPRRERVTSPRSLTVLPPSGMARGTPSARASRRSPRRERSGGSKARSPGHPRARRWTSAPSRRPR